MWLSIAELLNEELSQALPSTTARWTQTRFEATDRSDRTSHRQIQTFDQEIAKMADEAFPETQALTQYLGWAHSRL
jgi:hypothetical protein